MSQEVEENAPACGVGLNLLAVRRNKAVGVERFVRNVVGRVRWPKNRPVKVATRAGSDLEHMLGTRFIETHKNVTVSEWHVGTTAVRIMLEMIPLSFVFYNCERVLSINNFGPLFGNRRQKRTVVVHDVWFLSDVFDGPKAQSRIFKYLLKLQLRRTHQIITVSEFSKGEIVSQLGVSEDIIAVVPNCLDGEELKDLQISGDKEDAKKYFLLIGSDRRNKNVERAIKGFVRFAEGDESGIRLVVVGTYSSEYKERILREVDGISVTRIDFRGYVERSEFLELLVSSTAVVFPSLYEGYGIPVVEAMAHGKCVLVSRDTVCAEIAGPYGVEVDARNVESISAGLTVLKDKRIDPRAKGVEGYRDQFFGCETSAEMLAARLL